MKSTISIFLILVFVALCCFGCSNVPKEPPTSDTYNYSYVDPYGETVAAPENVDPSTAATAPVKYVETINNIECLINSYYVYSNSVAEIADIELEYSDYSVYADGYADLKITGIGSRKNDMKIAYQAFDANGELVRDTYILADLDNVKEGDIVEDCRFDFPRETVKIVFFDYVED